MDGKIGEGFKLYKKRPPRGFLILADSYAPVNVKPRRRGRGIDHQSDFRFALKGFFNPYAKQGFCALSVLCFAPRSKAIASGHLQNRFKFHQTLKKFLKMSLVHCV